MMNFKRFISIIALVLVTSLAVDAQVMSLDELAREGSRIGRQFQAALKAGDVEAQNAALNEIDAILATLKKQEQVDALTNAFNNCNVVITNPATDAEGYTLALGNAYVEGDTIGIEDAQDIIATVQRQYLERPADEQKMFDRYLLASRSALDLGLAARKAHGNTEAIKNIEAQVDELRTKQQGDSVALKLVNNIYGFYATVLTDIDSDAQLCADKIIEAQKTGSQELLNKAAHEVGCYYKRYAHEKGDDVAKEFNQKINTLMEGKYDLKQNIKK